MISVTEIEEFFEISIIFYYLYLIEIVFPSFSVS